MIDLTPSLYGPPAAFGQSSRDAALLRNEPAVRRDMVNVRLDGLRMPSGRVAPRPEMHIDVIVPDNGADGTPGANHDAIEDFLYGVRQSANLSPDERAALTQMTAETLHMAGEHYHFEGHNANAEDQDREPVTPVRRQDWPFFRDHPAYAFSVVGEVPEPAQERGRR